MGQNKCLGSRNKHVLFIFHFKFSPNFNSYCEVNKDTFHLTLMHPFQSAGFSVHRSLYLKQLHLNTAFIKSGDCMRREQNVSAAK